MHQELVKETAETTKKRVVAATGDMIQAISDAKRKAEEEKHRDAMEEARTQQERDLLAERERKHAEEILKKKQEHLQALDHAAAKTAEVLAAAQSKERAIEDKAFHSKQALPNEDSPKKYVAGGATKDTVAVLKQQMEERRKKGLEEKKENVELAAQWKQDAVEFQRKEREKASQHKKVMLENKATLRSQMEEKKRKSAQTMDKDEYLLNKQLLEKAKVVTLPGATPSVKQQ